MTDPSLWGRIPQELRDRAQWVMAGPDKMPMSVRFDAQGAVEYYGASSVAPAEWLPFETAAGHAYHKGWGIGYMLSPDDPYVCIDFDVIDADSQKRKGHPIDPAEWTTQDQFNWFWDIVNAWGSYAEVSTYGKGLHLWVRAKLLKGYRRANVEAYPHGRYIICTGKVALEAPIVDRNEWVNDFVTRYLIPFDRVDRVKLEETEALEDDDVILDRAREAANAGNFERLWRGEWQHIGYPSQSEADLALMSMFTFYSKSNEQCRRLFRMSALGKREKAVKNNRYLDFTLTTIRTRQANEAKQAAAVDQASDRYIETDAFKAQLDAVAAGRKAKLVLGHADPLPPAVVAALAAPASPESALAGEQGLPWPPGFTGVIAKFIYDSAPRPVKEVAIVGAVGLLAGLSGKAWHIPGSGLNLYMILVAQSAIGKEAMHSGIASIVTAVRPYCPTIDTFVNFNDFASGPALTKGAALSHSFVNVCGEWGHKLRRLAAGDGNDTAMSSLRRTMTDLYQKSGPQSIVGGITYSAKDQNIESVSGVAYSMIGETTPKTYFGALTETMMEDGFLSRFITVEYTGERPALNHSQLRAPPDVVIKYLAQMGQIANRNIGDPKHGSQMVGCEPDAYAVLQTFDLECDKEINGSKEESWRQMWNRAHLKVLRISALLAVADNYINPCITLEHTTWALLLIRKDISLMQRKLVEGDVGVDDSSRENKAMMVIREYFANPVPAGYKVPEAMRAKGIIPHKYMQMRCQKVPSFVAHRGGSTEALKQVMKSFIDAGYLGEATKVVENYAFHGKCYRILDLPDLISGSGKH